MNRFERTELIHLLEEMQSLGSEMFTDEEIDYLINLIEEDIARAD